MMDHSLWNTLTLVGNSNIIRRGNSKYINQGHIFDSGYTFPIETLACPTFEASEHDESYKMLITGTDRNDMNSLPEEEEEESKSPLQR